MVNWGNGAQGAASGAAMGSAAGPWGAVIGGAAGGLMGLFSGDDEAKQARPTSLPHFEEDRARLGGLLQGQSPFAGTEWGALIGQLQARAGGGVPSVAGNAYKQASQDSMNNLASLAQNSSSPSAVRQAQLQAGHIQQGMAQGYGAAALNEQQVNQSALGQALSARDQLNSAAYANILNQQMGLSTAQLHALQGNQGVALQQEQIDQAKQAAQWQAYAGLAAGLGKIYGSSGGSSGEAVSSGPITSPEQMDPFGKYRRSYS